MSLSTLIQNTRSIYVTEIPSHRHKLHRDKNVTFINIDIFCVLNLYIISRVTQAIYFFNYF